MEKKTDPAQSTQSAANISAASGQSDNVLSLNKDTQSSTCRTFGWSIYEKNCFNSTLLCLISLGMVHYLLYYMFIGYPRLHGFLQLILGYFGWEWYDLYGARLTRTKPIFFDETNILASSSRVDGRDACRGKYPSARLIKSLITDSNEAEMQAFYKQHNGNMFDIALRASKEAKAAEAISSSTIPSTDSLITVKSGASSYVTASSKASDTDEYHES